MQIPPGSDIADRIDSPTSRFPAISQLSERVISPELQFQASAPPSIFRRGRKRAEHGRCRGANEVHSTVCDDRVDVLLSYVRKKSAIAVAYRHRDRLISRDHLVVGNA